MNELLKPPFRVPQPFLSLGHFLGSAAIVMTVIHLFFKEDDLYNLNPKGTFWVTTILASLITLILMPYDFIFQNEKDQKASKTLESHDPETDRLKLL